MNDGILQEGLFIDGKSQAAVSGEVREIINPATESVIAVVADGGPDDVNIAVDRAEVAFRKSWKKCHSRDRTKMLLKLAGLIRSHSESLAVLESRNTGKPIRDARGEINLAADCFEYYAGAINKIGGQTVPVSSQGVNMTFREPIGICGLIVPWNFPLVITAWKVAPALAMGNCVILKPATQTPLSALQLGRLALEAGIPPGVFNIIPGEGNQAGEAIVRHPGVRKIAFTGSTTVGKDVMRLAAEHIKPVTLELGGKSANIVFADADVEKAIDGAVWSVLGNAGQDCCARSRLLVEKSLYPSFVDALAEKFGTVKLGEPLDESTEMGPLITRQHRERVEKYIELGQSEGANLRCGGDAPGFDSGYYLNPTLFTDVTPKMYIMQEEIFGPVLCATPFEDEVDAIRIANESIYGLSGSVWTRDGGKALRVARAVETGVISINSAHSVHLETPFGGMKESGIGRELGLAVLDNYCELKSVYFHTEE